MTTTEVNILRKQGKIAEAYNSINKLLQRKPNDIYIARTAAWVYIDILKQNAIKGDISSVLDELKLISSLQLPPSEELVFQNVVWGIRMLFLNMAKKTITPEKADVDLLFSLLYSMPVDFKHESYSALLNAALNIKDSRTQLFIIKLWNLNNLREEDYKKKEINGRIVMSLAERAFYAQCKAVLAMSNKDVYIKYMPILHKRRCQYPNYIYLSYFEAKMLMSVGSNTEALEVLKPFAQKKYSEFWIWQLIGDCHEKIDEKTMFYCKAISCKCSDEMAAKMRLQVGIFMFNNDKKELGKYLIEKAFVTYKNNLWHLPQELLGIIANSEYETANSLFDMNYVNEQAIKAESFLFGKLVEKTVLITHYSKERGILHFLTESGETYNGMLPKNTKQNIENGRTAVITTIAHYVGKMVKIRHVEILAGYDNPYFYKQFEGKLKLTMSGYGFVNGVFVPKSVLNTLKNGNLVRGIAMRSYDKKKDKWGWRALEVFPI